MLKYKGYTAGPIEFDADENTFSGTVAGPRYVIHFEGASAKELKRAFRESIDSYLDYSRETAQKMLRKTGGGWASRNQKRPSGAKAHRQLAARSARLKSCPDTCPESRRLFAQRVKPLSSGNLSRQIESAP